LSVEALLRFLRRIRPLRDQWGSCFIVSREPERRWRVYIGAVMFSDDDSSGIIKAILGKANPKKGAKKSKPS